MKLRLIIAQLLLSQILLAQTGGKNAFPFLNNAFSASIASQGGFSNATSDDANNSGIINPSLINTNATGIYSINQGILASGINYGQLATLIKLKKGYLLPNIRYIHYGKFNGYDENGIATNNFTAFDYIFGVSYCYPVNKVISIGVSPNIIGSQLETYNSFGISTNFGATFTHPNELLGVSIVAKNIGYQLKSYVPKNKSTLPIDIQAAISYKLKHAPFKFSLIAHHLNTWDITYFDTSIKPRIDGLTGDTISNTGASFGEKLARHFAYQVELAGNGAFSFRLGFNYNRRQELKLEQRPGMSGFSLGLGLKFKKFKLDYGFVIYSKAGFSNTIGLSAKLGKGKKK